MMKRFLSRVDDDKLDIGRFLILVVPETLHVTNQGNRIFRRKYRLVGRFFAFSFSEAREFLEVKFLEFMFCMMRRCWALYMSGMIP